MTSSNRSPSFRLMSVVVFLVVLVLTCGDVPPGSAAPLSPLFNSRVELSESGRTIGAVLCRGKLLFRFRATDHLTPPQTATDVALRLQTFYESGGTGQGLRITQRGQDSLIVGNGKTLVVVTPREAEENQSTPIALTRLWLQTLRMAFDLPWMWASPTTIPLGEDTPLTLQTNQSSKVALVAASRNEDILTVTTLPASHTLMLHGLQSGETGVDVKCGAAACSFDVTALPRAGRFIRKPGATLYGRRIPVFLLSQAVQNAVAISAQVEPGAHLLQGNPLRMHDFISPDTKSINVPVKITGVGYFPTEVLTAIPLQFESFPATSPAALWFSNDPERIRQLGVLFEQRLPAHQAARLFFHHKSLMTAGCDLVIEVSNYSTNDGAVAMIESSAGPDHDEIYSGHIACLNYLRQRQSGAGCLLTILAGRRYRAGGFSLPSGMVVSGIWELHNCGPADLRIQIKAISHGADELLSALDDLPLSSKENPHVYPEVTRVIDARYEVGGNWTFIEVGKKATRSLNGQEKLDGNYGMEYRVNLKITNPLPYPAPVSIVFSPTGGVARGVVAFETDREKGVEWVEVPPCAPPNEFILRKFTLPPNASETTSFITMPEAGSYYPVSLVVRADRLP